MARTLTINTITCMGYPADCSAQISPLGMLCPVCRAELKAAAASGLSPADYAASRRASA